MRRRIATITTAVGIAVLMTFMGSAQASAAMKWQSHGLAGVKAWGTTYKGSYKGKKTRVVRANIKDTAKDGRVAAIKVAFTKKGYRTDYRYLWNRHGAGTTAKGAIQSYNTTHTYIRECKGKVKSGRFKPSKCGRWRQYR